MTKSHGYAIDLKWTGAVDGPTTDIRSYSRNYEYSAEGKKPVPCSADKVFRGDPGLYNPEDGLVASLSGCHLLSYLAVCALGKVEVVAYEDHATGTLTQEGLTAQFTEVILRPRVTISRSSDPAEAERLHEDAHHNCFVARSVNFPVRVEPEIIVGS